MLHHLVPLSVLNAIIKFADDASLLAPERSYTDISVEFDNVLEWTKRNRMIINLPKTKFIKVYSFMEEAIPAHPIHTGLPRNQPN